jgi:hypothetical protein
MVVVPAAADFAPHGRRALSAHQIVYWHALRFRA